MMTFLKTLPREAADELWEHYWQEMRRDWFKPEVPQDYSRQDAGPFLSSWLEGDRQRSITLMKAENHQEWARSCQQKLAQGVNLTRIHVLEEPYSPYIEWEPRIMNT